MIRKRWPDTDWEDYLTQERDDQDYTPVELTDWCCLPVQEFLSVETRAELDRAIRRLSETQHIVFILRDLQGLAIQETSQVLYLTDSLLLQPKRPRFLAIPASASSVRSI